LRREWSTDFTNIPQEVIVEVKSSKGSTGLAKYGFPDMSQSTPRWYDFDEYSWYFKNDIKEWRMTPED
jgi:hypothetical protein